MPHSRLRWLTASGCVLLSACATTTAGNPLRPSVSSSPTRPAATRTVTVAPSDAATRSFAGLYRREQSGVVRIETVSCTESGLGSGFLLSNNLVLTVEHVVREAAVISLIIGTQRATGTIVGVDKTK